MRHLASAKPNRRLHLIALLQPFARALHAIAVVVHVCAGAKLHFLDGDDDLFLLRFVRFFLGFVLELAEIDNLANGRLGVWRNLDEIQSSLARRANRLARIHDSEWFAFVSDHAHLRNADPFVDSSNRRAPKIWATAASITCSYVCTSSVKVSSSKFQVSSCSRLLT